MQNRGCSIYLSIFRSFVSQSRMVSFSAMDPPVTRPQFPMPLKVCRICLAKSQFLEFVWTINYWARDSVALHSRLKFGHHGGNHPVRHLPTGLVEISAQLCSYPDTLPEGVQVTHINLNDGTFPAMIATSFQYHPEASPGPQDSDQAYFDFVEMMKKNRSKA